MMMIMMIDDDDDDDNDDDDDDDDDDARGLLEVYMTGGSDVFFWVENLHARYFFGSRDLSRTFLGLKKIRVWVLSPSELFVSGFRCDQWIRKIFIRTFFQRRVFRKNC